MSQAGRCVAMKRVWLVIFLMVLRFLPCGEPQSSVPALIQSSVPAPTEAPLPPNENDGSTCAQWLYGTEPPQVEVFQCMAQRTGFEVKYCCGTCGQTSNCYFEKLLVGTSARPTDSALEPCPPSPSSPYIDRITWFWGGVLANAIFYWAFIRTCRRFWRRKTSAGERPVEGLELGTSPSGRLNDPTDPSDAATILVPQWPEGAEGPATAPKVQARPGVSEKATIMGFPTGFVPTQIGPTPSKPKQPKRSRKKPRLM